ncbi:MAG: ricin-type beta-trefoil lectin domain protein [Aulosira sp. DedQUE10]|nr:ricin-type beta-trefoil lectin domain protein [Aulosira sp. DedQUE10]
MSHNICKSVALAIASLSVVLSVGSASAHAETFSVQEGMALNTNNNFSRIDGNPRMSIYRRNDSDNDQQFERLSVNGGATLLKHRSTGKCLNAHYLTNGSQINVWPCNANDPDQKWNLVDVGNGFNLIKRAGTNLCVDTPTRDNQGKVHLWNCDGNNGNQRWKSSVDTIVTTKGLEAFVKSVVGQRYIARLDNRPELNGQCVSLIARYLAEVFFPPNQRTQSLTLGNGKDVASYVARNYSQYFQPLTNQGLPKRGAVISFPTIGVISGVTYGHVAIVMDAQQLPNGQRQVKIMDSGLDPKVNNGYVKEQTWWINIPDGRAQNYGTGIVWTNPK